MPKVSNSAILELSSETAIPFYENKMDVVPTSASTGDFAFSSSVSADVWHPKKDSKAYEWWYFDALGDGGREAIIIVFLDNFIYSPRYNRDAEDGRKFPAVSFTYFSEGKPLYRCVTEYDESDFEASRTTPECRIGDSSFKFESASYGSGYTVFLNAKLSGDRRLEAHLEWLSIESDFSAQMGFVEAPALGLDLPLDVRGTAFQRRVWQALQKIPAGSTASYADIANQIGSPTSVRAVAQACGANALAVAIPCHRVVRRDGALSGYRWGVERKRALIEREAGA